MTDAERGFWAAIEAAPDDDLPKLVFADYLDERGDPRGACLRWVVATGRQPRSWFRGYRRYTWVPLTGEAGTACVIPRVLGAYLDPRRYGGCYATQARGPATYDYLTAFQALFDLTIGWKVRSDLGLSPFEPSSAAILAGSAAGPRRGEGSGGRSSSSFLTVIHGLR